MTRRLSARVIGMKKDNRPKACSETKDEMARISTLP